MTVSNKACRECLNNTITDLGYSILKYATGKGTEEDPFCVMAIPRETVSIRLTKKEMTTELPEYRRFRPVGASLCEQRVLLIKQRARQALAERIDTHIEQGE